MKHNLSFPPLPTATDWSKLDRIEAELSRHRESLDRMKSGLDGMGLEKMKQTLDAHREFQADRSGPFGWLYRWCQTSGR